jgi:hypothetical protein
VNRRGVVLIEVLAALVILAMGGLSVLALLSSVSAAQARAYTREAEAEKAQRVMASLALLSRAELSQRLGARSLGGFVVWVDRPEASLFRVGVAPTEAPSLEILVTLLYRPEPEPEGNR